MILVDEIFHVRQEGLQVFWIDESQVSFVVDGNQKGCTVLVKSINVDLLIVIDVAHIDVGDVNVDVYAFIVVSDAIHVSL